MYGSSTPLLNLAKQTALIISNEKMEDIMQIVKSFEESGFLIKRISETIKNDAKNKKVYFFQCY